MIKREEVEDLLLICDQRPVLMPSRVSVDSDTLAELARTWLRVNDAPVGRTVARDESWKRGGQTGVQIELDGVVPVGLLQRVRLVPEADSGGDTP